MKVKNTFVALVVLALVGLAVFQVSRYFGNGRGSPGAAKREIVVESAFRDYDVNQLRSESDSLTQSLVESVRRALQGLPGNQRPSGSDVDRISAAFAKYIVLRRTATREEYLAQTLREPMPGLVSEDAELADAAWSYESAWARHAGIPVESVRVEPVFIRGELVGSFEQRGQRSVRALPNGKRFSAETVGGYSVYQVLMDMTVPTVDAKEDLDVTVGSMLINDGPGGAWVPVAVEFIGVPRGKFCYTPSP